MSEQVTSRIWCDRASYYVVGSVSEVEKLLSWALEDAETPQRRTPFVYFDRATKADTQIAINASKVSSVEPSELE